MDPINNLNQDLSNKNIKKVENSTIQALSDKMQQLETLKRQLEINEEQRQKQIEQDKEKISLNIEEVKNNLVAEQEKETKDLASRLKEEKNLLQWRKKAGIIDEEKLFQKQEEIYSIRKKSRQEQIDILEKYQFVKYLGNITEKDDFLKKERKGFHIDNKFIIQNKDSYSEMYDEHVKEDQLYMIEICDGHYIYIGDCFVKPKMQKINIIKDYKRIIRNINDNATKTAYLWDKKNRLIDTNCAIWVRFQEKKEFCWFSDLSERGVYKQLSHWEVFTQLCGYLAKALKSYEAAGLHNPEKSTSDPDQQEQVKNQAREEFKTYMSGWADLLKKYKINSNDDSIESIPKIPIDTTSYDIPFNEEEFNRHVRSIYRAIIFQPSGNSAKEGDIQCKQLHEQLMKKIDFLDKEIKKSTIEYLSEKAESLQEYIDKEMGTLRYLAEEVEKEMRKFINKSIRPYKPLLQTIVDAEERISFYRRIEKNFNQDVLKGLEIVKERKVVELLEAYALEQDDLKKEDLTLDQIEEEIRKINDEIEKLNKRQISEKVCEEDHAKRAEKFSCRFIQSKREIAYQAALHTLKHWNVTPDQLPLDQYGDVSSDKKYQPLHFDIFGKARSPGDNAIHRAYGLLVFEASTDCSPTVFVGIKARENPYPPRNPSQKQELLYCAGTPGLFGGAVELEDYLTLSPTKKNPYKNAVLRELSEEGRGEYQATGKIENYFYDHNNGKNHMFFYVIRGQKVTDGKTDNNQGKSREMEKVVPLSVQEIDNSQSISAVIKDIGEKTCNEENLPIDWEKNDPNNKRQWKEYTSSTSAWALGLFVKNYKRWKEYLQEYWQKKKR